jgi:hypothetical protein
MKILTGYVETSPMDLGVLYYCYVMIGTRRFKKTNSEMNIRYRQIEGLLSSFNYCFKSTASANYPFLMELTFGMDDNPSYKYTKNVNVE